jgi:hypothetical protein
VLQTRVNNYYLLLLLLLLLPACAAGVEALSDITSRKTKGSNEQAP